MALIRIGPESDIYMYRDRRGIRCYGCRIVLRDADVEQHLLMHQARGDKIGDALKVWRHYLETQRPADG
jgi:hypothetical protein